MRRVVEAGRCSSRAEVAVASPGMGHLVSGEEIATIQEMLATI
jgi:hypothetical protein